MKPFSLRVNVSSESGQILILTALSLVVTLGIAALSIDASFMYDKRNRLHAAADAAAKTAAIEVKRGNSSQTNLEAFANQQVTAHGFNPGTTTVVVINHPPLSGPYTGNSGFVEAIVSEATSTFFGGVLGFTSMTPRARAVAGTGPSPDCLIALGGGPLAPTALSIGNTVLSMPGCSVNAGGNLATTNPNADIDADGTGLSGTCTGTGCSNISNLSTGIAPPTDPLSTLPEPSNPGGCVALNNPTGVINPGCYTTLTASNTTLTFAGGGIYYFTGPVLLGNNVTVNTNAGLMWFFAGSAATAPCAAGAPAGCINVANSATFNLSAMTSGPYNGILMFQARANHLNAEFDGNNPIYNLSGAMYFPGADVSFRNGLNATNDCMLFVTRTLLVNNGNGLFDNTCAAYGGSPVLSIAVAE
jgi:Putative Flp pilus-assembly TadE/G-like